MGRFSNQRSCWARYYADILKRWWDVCMICELYSVQPWREGIPPLSPISLLQNAKFWRCRLNIYARVSGGLRGCRFGRANPKLSVAEMLWRTDLDWLMLPHDHCLVQNFVTQLNISSTLVATAATAAPVPAPLVETQTPQIVLQGERARQTLWTAFVFG